MLLIGDMDVFSVLVNQEVSLKMYYSFVLFSFYIYKHHAIKNMQA